MEFAQLTPWSCGQSLIGASEFLPFLMMSDAFMNRAMEISVGSLSPTINWTTLRRRRIRPPPLDQQMRIAEMMWAVDDVMRSCDLLLDSLAETLRVQIDGLLPSPDDYQRNVSFARLDEIARMQNGRPFQALSINRILGPGYLIRPGNLAADGTWIGLHLRL